MFYTRAMRAEYRDRAVPVGAEPRQGHAVRLVAEPVHGLRAPLHVLLRPRVRATRRPAEPTSATARRSASRRTSPTCCGASSHGRRGAARASRSAPPPIPTSRPRGASGSPAPASRRSPTAANPFGLITRGPLIVRDLDVLAEAARRAEVSVTFSVPTLDDEVWRRTEPGTAPAAPAAARARAARRRRDPRLGRDGADPAGASPTGPSSSPRSSAPRATPAPAGSGRTCSTCGPGTREHFLESLARDWPELLPEYERLYASRAYLRDADTSRVRETPSASSPRADGIRDRRRTPLAPPPERSPMQLSSRLAI